MPYIDLTLIGLPRGIATPRISDKEAAALYDIWAKSPPGGELEVAISEARALEGKGLLKSRGRQEGTFGRFSLTDEGRKIIVDMVTNETNKFDRTKSAMPSYREILAKAKRAKQTFIKKAMNYITAADSATIQRQLEELRSKDPEAATAFDSMMVEPEDLGGDMSFDQLDRFQQQERVIQNLSDQLVQCVMERGRLQREKEKSELDSLSPSEKGYTRESKSKINVRVAGFDVRKSKK